MRVVDVLNSPWAIVESRLDEICAIYESRARGHKIDVAALEAALGRQLANEQPEYDVLDGVAVLPVQGVIAKRMNLFTQISGGVSTQLLQASFEAALADPEVHSIVLAVDSPGGTVDGTQQVARAIYNARGQKPIVALADGMMASGAYWIGSAADRVYYTSGTDQIGSIGVIVKHVDYSKQNEEYGVKVTPIRAGKYKQIAHSDAPLSTEGEAVLQAQVDEIYTMFVDTVAQHRGVSSQKVLRDMADGRVFFGKAAQEAGLVDGEATLGELVAQLNRQNDAGHVESAANPKYFPDAQLQDLSDPVKLHNYNPSTSLESVMSKKTYEEELADSQRIASKAQDFMHAEAKVGRNVSLPQAVAHVMEEEKGTKK